MTSRGDKDRYSHEVSYSKGVETSLLQRANHLRVCVRPIKVCRAANQVDCEMISWWRREQDCRLSQCYYHRWPPIHPRLGKDEGGASEGRAETLSEETLPEK